MDLPLHVSSALEEEYTKLHRADPPPAFPSALLTPDQVLEGERILAELRVGGKAAQYVAQRIPAERLKALAGNGQIAAALNELIAGPSIYNKAIFSHRLPQQLVNAAQHFADCTTEQRQYINRLVLEFTFPDAMSRIDDVRMLAISRALRARNTFALCLSGGGIRSATVSLG